MKNEKKKRDGTIENKNNTNTIILRKLYYTH